MRLEKRLRLSLVLLLVLHVVPVAAAGASINLSFHIAEGKTIANGVLAFDIPYTGNVTLAIPLDAVALAVYADDKIQPMRIEEQLLSLSLHETRKLRWSYASKSYLEKTSFIANIVFPIDAKTATIRLALPEKAILTKPVTQTSGSVFPQPAELTTDGQAITLVWRKKGIIKGESFPVYVTYDTQKLSAWQYMGIILGVLFFLGIVTYHIHRAVWKRQRRGQQDVKVDGEQVPKAKTVETYLKQDEQQILQILKQREGQCEQGTLRVITGFSKAKLSSLLKELEERKIVFREKRGKKNLVFLKEL